MQCRIQACFAILKIQEDCASLQCMKNTHPFVSGLLCCLEIPETLQNRSSIFTSHFVSALTYCTAWCLVFESLIELDISLTAQIRCHLDTMVDLGCFEALNLNPTTINDLPDELLIRVLALIPYTRDQHVILKLVNNRFRELMSSKALRFKTFATQLPELFALYPVADYTTSDLEFFFKKENSINKAVERLAHSDDCAAQKSALKFGVRLLDYTDSVALVQELTREQKLAFMLRARNEAFIPEVLTTLRFVTERLFQKYHLLEARYMLPIFLDGMAALNPGFSNARAIFTFAHEHFTLRAFESALLLETDIPCTLQLMASEQSQVRLEKIFPYQKPLLRWFIEAHRDFTGRPFAPTAGISRRDVYLRSRRWCLLCPEDIFVRKPEDDRAYDERLNIMAIKTFFDDVHYRNIQKEVLELIVQKENAGYWKTVAMALLGIAVEVRERNNPAGIEVPSSLDTMLRDLDVF